MPWPPPEVSAPTQKARRPSLAPNAMSPMPVTASATRETTT